MCHQHRHDGDFRSVPPSDRPLDPEATIILGNLWEGAGAANSPSASIEALLLDRPHPREVLGHSRRNWIECEVLLAIVNLSKPFLQSSSEFRARNQSALHNFNFLIRGRSRLLIQAVRAIRTQPSARFLCSTRKWQTTTLTNGYLVT